MKTTLILILCSFWSMSIFAQDLDPVSWAFSSSEVSKGNHKVSFTANVESGWAIYSQFTDPEGPIPTSFVFEENENIELVENVIEPDDKEKKYDEMFEVDVIKLKGKPEFYQIVKAQSGQVLKGYVTFMSCDDSKCLPPKDVNFEITIE